MAVNGLAQAVDPRRMLGDSPMRAMQIVAIAICVALNALDGFDVLSISFASPGIAKEWGIDRAALGIVLSIELIGMTAGSLALGQVADRLGRRLTAIVCLLVMASGMFATSHVSTIGELAVTRLFTGLGIGGMLATTNAMAAEFSNDRWRGTAVAVMASGYPLGAIIGGSIASQMLVSGTWREVFLLGAGMTALMLPLVLLFLPETVHWLLQHYPENALARVNSSLAKLGHDRVDALPPAPQQVGKTSIADLFSGGLARVTGLLTVVDFFHIMTFYFILKWTPKIVHDMGFAPSAAGGVLVWANVGGLIGGLLFSVAILRLPLKTLAVVAMLASSLMVTWFGQSPADLHRLSLAAAMAGFCTNGVIVGLYALLAKSFPTALRAGGTGFVIGVGRGGAALGPIVAGFLFQSGLGLGLTAAIMAMGSLIAAAALLALPEQNR